MPFVRPATVEPPRGDLARVAELRIPSLAGHGLPARLYAAHSGRTQPHAAELKPVPAGATMCLFSACSPMRNPWLALSKTSLS